MFSTKYIIKCNITEQNYNLIIKTRVIKFIDYKHIKRV